MQTATWSSFACYGFSKLANILFTEELARRWRAEGIDATLKTYSLHPGVVATDIWKGWPVFIQKIGKVGS